MGDVELLAGQPETAELVLRDLCEELERIGNFNLLSTRASDLAEALYAQDRLPEAEEWTNIAESHAGADDLGAQFLWRSVRAKIVACYGGFEAAEYLASEAVRLADLSDGLNRRARVQHDVGDVLCSAGRSDEAAVAFDRAVDLYVQKGNIAGAANTRVRREDLVALERTAKPA